MKFKKGDIVRIKKKPFSAEVEKSIKETTIDRKVTIKK